MANRGETSSSRTHTLPKPYKRPKTLLSHVVDFFLPSWLADYLGIKLPNGCRTCERRNFESRDFECSCSEQEKYLAEAQQQTIQSPSASNFLQPPYSSSLIETPMDCPKPLLINPSFNPAGLFIFGETTKTPTAISGDQRSSSTLKSCNLDRLKKSAKSSQQTFQSASADADASASVSASADAFVYASAYASASACNLQTPNVASSSSTAPMNWPAMPAPPPPFTSPIPISSYTPPTPLASAPPTPLSSAPLTPLAPAPPTPLASAPPTRPCPCVFGQNTNKFISTPPLPASRSIFYETV